MVGSHRRRRIALVTCLVWLVAVEVLPNVHLATHRADHTHAADGTIVNHGDHQHVLAARPTKPHARQLAIHGPLPLGHAAAGIAHRAIAIQSPPPPVLAPLAIERTTTWLTAAPTESPTSRHAARPSARGPPIA